MRKTLSALVRGLVAALMFMALNGYANANGVYLDALNAEAERTCFGTGASSCSASQTLDVSVSVTRAVDHDAAIPGRSFDDFVVFLRERHSGIWRFYRHLTPGQQREVFAQYSEDQSIQKARRQVIEMSSVAE